MISRHSVRHTRLEYEFLYITYILLSTESNPFLSFFEITRKII
uniref:Uncharacterized protein n=1 Tax=Schistosoma japonicum TaxID=6182 RepID=Q5BYQ6_SCHJA|nr:unknown [Schistosoma japonicum]